MLALKAAVISCYYISATAVFPAKAGNLVEGKCGILETGAYFTKCTLLKSGNLISALTNNGSNLILNASRSEILRIGPLSDEVSNLSPESSKGLGIVLAGLSTSKTDAEKSNNVRIISFIKDFNTRQSFIFIADRRQENTNNLSFVAPYVATLNTSSTSTPELPPSDASAYLEEYDRAFNRIQGLYDSLMFEEADRVLDRTIASINNFSKRYSGYQGAFEIQTFLNSRIAQAESLRSLKSYEYQQAQWQAEMRYARIQKEKADAEERQRQHQYRLAVERRKTAEANARQWLAIWLLVRPPSVNVINNTTVITR
ncbi:hypothetical protein [Synechococcus sp. 8F6]|uniref:hypothetical protein n=1 Tax=Synechococcus sp. 8F6 TaxID=2025606 RepID=UPI001180CA64|nr:hypothetical protein [Synechococcus sp. 8F6]